MLNIDQYLEPLINHYGILAYFILFLIIFIETGLVVTPFLPGDSLLFAAGAFAALGSLNLLVLLFILISAAILGDTVNYHIGKLMSDKWLNKKHNKFIKKEYIDKTNAYYEKYGGKTLIIARFVPIVRTFAPFVAGLGKMHYGKFISYNAIGGFAWVTVLTLIGYFFGNITIVKNHFSLVTVGIIFISILPALYEIIKYKVQSADKV